jgi:hypothetical protein
MATFHFQLSQNYGFIKNKYHFKKSTQAEQGAQKATWGIFSAGLL